MVSCEKQEKDVMLSRLRQFLAAPEPPAIADAEWVRVAVCVLLVEVAKADDEFSEDEREHIVDTLTRRFELSEDDAHDLLDLAHEHRKSSTDLWRFTNVINRQCAPAEKIEIMEEIWRVIYADGTLDAHEDYLAHKFARLLNLSHPQLIQAKLTVLDERRQGEEKGSS
jgi:uncharacterized tellurite resistance protein B-like protein